MVRGKYRKQCCVSNDEQSSGGNGKGMKAQLHGLHWSQSDEDSVPRHSNASGPGPKIPLEERYHACETEQGNIMRGMRHGAVDIVRVLVSEIVKMDCGCSSRESV